MTLARRSRSSAGPTSASRRSSTGSSAAARTIVEERPGVTRDRKELDAEWAGGAFSLVDTGGWLAPKSATDDARSPRTGVSAQAERAMRDADVLLLVVDATVGITDEDAGVAAAAAARRQARARRRQQGRRRAPRDRRLGVRRPRARRPDPGERLHGRGSGDLLDAVVAALPPESEVTARRRRTRSFSVAIVGRPNVGKSTLFNRLIGDERSVVHDSPGTTRDAIDTVVETPDGPIRFVDTAGLRRRSRIDEPTEYYGLVRALEAIDRADAALLVIDATAGVTHQDQRLAERVDAAGTPIVVVLNKWELLDGDAERRRDGRSPTSTTGSGSSATRRCSRRRPSPAAASSRILPALREAEAAYHRRIPTAALNRVVQEAQAAHPPPAVRRRRPRVLYATQGATDPPTFTLFATDALPPTYLRYLERRIREPFELGPTPLKLRVRRRTAPDGRRRHRRGVWSNRAVPWCLHCDRYLTPPTVRDRRHLPELRAARRRRPRARHAPDVGGADHGRRAGRRHRRGTARPLAPQAAARRARHLPQLPALPRRRLGRRPRLSRAGCPPIRSHTLDGLWRSLVSASVWGTEGPGFESRQPDQRHRRSTA